MQLHTVVDAYSLLTLLSSTVIIILGILLKQITLPTEATQSKIRGARNYLSLSYLILGVLSFLSISVGEARAEDRLLLLLITAFIAAFQALLFTSTLLVFIQPQQVKSRWIYRQIGYILVAGTVLTAGWGGGNDQTVPWIYVLTLVLYAVQQVYYVRRFRHAFQQCILQMEEYYGEEQQARMHWVKFSFYSALCIGLLSIVSSLSGIWVFTCFIVAYTAYYTYVVVRFYNYRYWGAVLQPVVSAPDSNTPIDFEIHPASPDLDASHLEEDEAFGARLKEWVAQKGYLQKDLSVDEIAEILGTNRNYLRYYFRTYIQSDFRTWRSELRIREAQHLLKSHPEYTLNQVADMTGFNHRANFFSQFQKITGVTPTFYRDQDKTC